jgi:hypothetical protein
VLVFGGAQERIHAPSFDLAAACASGVGGAATTFQARADDAKSSKKKKYKQNTVARK